jgi:hypothetical protein
MEYHFVLWRDVVRLDDFNNWTVPNVDEKDLLNNWAMPIMNRSTCVIFPLRSKMQVNSSVMPEDTGRQVQSRYEI